MWTYDNKMITLFHVKNVTTVTIPFNSIGTAFLPYLPLCMLRQYADFLYFGKNTSKIIRTYIKILLIF